MSVDLTRFKNDLYSIQILEEGVSLYSEKFGEFLNIDDVLVFGFISALYSYTYAIGHEEVKSIDFGSCKFLFSKLFDDRLLVVIAKDEISHENEQILLKNITLRYEILTDDKSIGQITSLLEIEDTIIPLDIVAEIRKKRHKVQEEIAMPVDLPMIPEIQIPAIKFEEFFVEMLTEETQLSPEKTNTIKKTLTNFFLGYKTLISSLFAIAKEDHLISFVFSRQPFDEIYPLVQYIITNPSEINVSKEVSQSHIKQVKISDKNYFVLIYLSKEQNTKSVVFSKNKGELEALTPHLKRISAFVEKMI
ncbi:MAG: hypothetical protein GOP50_06540 [Candidatus Heimdallarchaeota archaeon]|nr:hypothetical protein [Candidatus Heimdallarchaeota archaeon]